MEGFIAFGAASGWFYAGNLKEENKDGLKRLHQYERYIP